MTRTVDVCIVGGGRGGLGAAVSAPRNGARTRLIETASALGDTSTLAGVNNSEPVAGET
ncbi:MAG TPA: hypothetical protein DHW45_09730 [Candidatus Latescibacteria bacterium]|nr:hypothetical protein [Candidatus Latescibacterota bacterium]